MIADKTDTTVEMFVNQKLIVNKPYVDELIAGVTEGLVCSLKAESSFKRIEININNDGLVTIKVDDSLVETNSFVNNAFETTLVGMASVLGVTESVNSLNIKLERC
jgi:hypothetical protein